MTPFRAISRATCGLLLLPSLARADSEPAFLVRGLASLPEEVRVELGRLGEPTWQTATAPGTTLRDMLRVTCGSQGAKTDALLSQRMLELNGGDSLERKIRPGTAVALPFCVEVSPVKVVTGDTLEQLLREHYIDHGPRTVRQTFELNNASGRWSTTDAFAHNLPVDHQIFLPSANARPFVLRREGSSGEEAQQLQAVLSTFSTTLRGALAPLAENTEPPRAPAEYDYVKFVTEKDASGTPDCGPPSSPYPLDLDALTARLAAEASAAGPQATTALVGIIDTGVGGIGGPFFATRFFAATEAEVNGGGQGTTSGSYGINFNGPSQAGWVSPYAIDPERHHGTEIASLVLGGPDWVRAQNASFPPSIQLKIVNFSDATRPMPVSASNLYPAIKYLDKQGAAIVNMSLADTVPAEPAFDAMETSSKTLFVVAAGNAPRGQNLATTGYYPAAQGGRAGALAARLLTVGAHDNVGAWAQFSNYSSEYVDLLAPGCRVATIDADGHDVEAYGTSVATAIVTFAAALVRSLGENDPQAIKNRLLASVDVDPSLERRAWTSGRLNVLKALSLRHDLIELQVPGPYNYGHLVDRDELRQFCDDDTERPLLSRLLKVHPNVVRSDGTYVEYWGLRSDGTIWREQCRQRLADQPIGRLRAGDGHEGDGPLLRDVRDIVLATKLAPD